ncbi:ABC transporter substrate-binding protein [Georgenia sp. Z1491]|uniref:ABC transporter substrate-binding protein n=1 Tax=Georgenia sp. Z1491 TaxID=3416707 RepID=UPI003CF3863C
MRRHLSVISLAAVTAAVLAACGGDGEASSTSESPTEGADGLTDITVQVMPIVDTAPFHLGLEQGIFEEHGLDITFDSTNQGGAVTIPGVTSGDYDFGFSNSPALITGVSNGLPLTIVANASSSNGDPDGDTAGIIVPPDSDITSPADLAGRSVAVNTLNSIGDTSVRATVNGDGGDGSTIEFVELAFPDAPNAVLNGDVDAAWVVEPFVTIARNAGLTYLTSPYVGADPNLNIAVYFTSQQLADENPELVQAFADAMHEAQAYAQDNPDEVRDVMGTYTEIDEDVRAEVTLPAFHDDVTAEEIQTVIDMLAEQGVVPESFPAEDMMFTAE